MKHFFRLYGFIIFWIIAAIDIIAIFLKNHQIPFLAKPFLLPILMLVLYFTTESANKRWLLLTGLLFSFLGDVFLLFDESNALFFIFGLLSFLLTHIFYILFFLSIKRKNTSILSKKPYLLLLVIIYTGSLLYLLIPHLGALIAPVIIYAVVLSSMFVCSLLLYNNIDKKAAMLFIAGAAFFVASDSLLAINKFYAPVAYSGLFIMSTYCIAQYLIVKAFIQMQQSSVK